MTKTIHISSIRNLKNCLLHACFVSECNLAVATSYLTRRICDEQTISDIWTMFVNFTKTTICLDTCYILIQMCRSFGRIKRVMLVFCFFVVTNSVDLPTPFSLNNFVADSHFSNHLLSSCLLRVYFLC